MEFSFDTTYDQKAVTAMVRALRKNPAQKAQPGLIHTFAVFSEESYHTATEMGNTEWFYANILSVVELPEYFVFLFSKNHAQIYAKAGMTGGSPADFRTFIAAKTGKDVLSVK